MATLTDISPSPANLGPEDAFAFTVSAASTRTIVVIDYPSLVFQELVFDGDVFTNAYANVSSRADLGGGSFRYTVRRQPIWPAAPTARVFAFDGGTEL